MRAPVTYDASSDARYDTAAATSSGVARRPSGISASVAASAASGSSWSLSQSSMSGVRAMPGASTFTRIPCGASSTAAPREYASSAPFAAVYVVCIGTPDAASRDDMLMIAPPPASFIARAAAAVMVMAAIVLSAKFSTSSACGVSTMSPACRRPALFTSTSSLPKRVSTSATTRSGASASVRSAATNSASPSAAAASASGADRAHTATRIPSACSRCAIARALTDDPVDRGAELLAGGTALGDRGHFFAATLLDRVPADADIAQTEIFGPIAAIQRFSTEDEAIERANDTEFGLASYVFSESLDRALNVADRIQSGIVGINQGVPSNAAAPFGGVKQSGVGREGSAEGLEEYQSVRFYNIARRETR